MRRFKAFFKDSWWLWLVFVSAAIFLILVVSPVFWAVLPMILVTFIYFALVRYDEDGNFIGA